MFSQVFFLVKKFIFKWTMFLGDPIIRAVDWIHFKPFLWMVHHPYSWVNHKAHFAAHPPVMTASLSLTSSCECLAETHLLSCYRVLFQPPGCLFGLSGGSEHLMNRNLGNSSLAGMFFCLNIPDLCAGCLLVDHMAWILYFVCELWPGVRLAACCVKKLPTDSRFQVWF